ncbi:hypothetical protein DVH24_006148 [Malus domestica]|uniref:COBRA-like protein n=1 Tax=Malus domestica TaxID=3750 RepID=A0A498KST9_MALDO|nr:hypothetical protein DVH24_006148 [Malus domestica]
MFVVAYDPFDPKGSINIRWDVVSWTSDGYVAAVTISNNQMYRPVTSPGLTLGWTWAKKEVIWSMAGAQATDQGYCSKFKGNIPHSCSKIPSVVDLPPTVPYNQRFSDCCKGGVLESLGQDPSAAVSAFQLSVGHSGTSNKTVRPPKNFFLLGPGPGYTCSAATIVPPSVSYSADGLRKTRAMNHMCPIRVHWHVKANYRAYWRVRIAVANFKYRMNYTQWTLVAQHPNLNKLANVSSFFYKPLIHYNTNDTGMFYGIKNLNNLLMEAGTDGHVESELILQKNTKEFTLKQGWAFPLMIYFNGDECKMPLPDIYPSLPNFTNSNPIPSSTLATLLLSALLLVFFSSRH